MNSNVNQNQEEKVNFPELIASSKLFKEMARNLLVTTKTRMNTIQIKAKIVRKSNNYYLIMPLCCMACCNNFRNN
jgi:hypothetical protein